MDTCTKVFLRRKEISGGRLSLYLDFYPPIRNPHTNRLSRREGLGIYLYANPQSAGEREFNASMEECNRSLKSVPVTCIGQDNIERDKFRFIVIERVFRLLNLTYENNPELDLVRNLVIKALDLAKSDVTDTAAARQLGEGWIAEETLAIAIFSVMRYIDDFEKCMVCAVNHDGDSDSTGAVAGNIIGAILGYSAIPDKYLGNLELHDVLVSVADDLSGFSADVHMKERYGKHQPYGIDKELLIKQK